MGGLEVRKIPKELTYEWLRKKHYAHRIPSISYSFGLYDDGIIKGVCTFGIPSSSPLRDGICGEEYSRIVLELNRLVLNEGVAKNAASYFIARCFKELPHPTIVVSFSDTSVGHIGYVYQSLNFIYTGLSAKRTNWKVKGLEHLHGQSIADISRGTTNRAEFMRQKYGDDFYLEDRSRKHRYVYFIGGRRQKKKLEKSLKYPILPYPKGESKRYDSSRPLSGVQGLMV